MKRIGLLSVMTLAALNIWTGAPLLAVWVGSRSVSPAQPTRRSNSIGVVVRAATCLALVYVLNNASAAYDELTGRKQAVRRHVPWLRSMRAERVEYEAEKAGTTALEKLLVGMVVLAVTLFEIWFFFFSPSPIPAA